MSILIVEDDRDLTDVLAYILRREGHEVRVAHDGATALELWQDSTPRLILLDLDIPRVSGWDVCSQVRGDSETPVIMLTASSGDDNIVRGLELGADDYITKPFSPRQLLARIRAVLRRQKRAAGSKPREQVLRVADLVLDIGWRRVRKGKAEVPLTKLEFRLLHELALNAGQLLSYRFITDRVWGYKGVNDASLIKGHIRNLRRKLGVRPDGKQYVETVQGTGYIFRA